MIETKEVNVVVRCRQLTPGEVEIRVAPDSLIEHFDSLKQFLVDLRVGDTCNECFAADVKGVGDKIPGRAFLDGGLLLWGDRGLQLRGNALHDITLHSKNVARISLVADVPQLDSSSSIG